jgi:hypothetical protein
MALNLSSTANRLLLRLCDSNDYSLAYQTGGTEDPDTGKYTPGKTVSIPVDSAAEDTASFARGGDTNTQAGDIFLMLPPKIIIPDVDFWVNVRGQRYAVIDKLPFYNGGILQYRELQLRRS